MWPFLKFSFLFFCWSDYTYETKNGKANKRNLIKRRIKEIIRLNVCDLGLGYEMVILPKKNTLEIDYIELERSLLRLINFALKKVLNWED